MNAKQWYQRIFPCKCSLNATTFRFSCSSQFLSFSSPKHTHKLSPFYQSEYSHTVSKSKLSTTDHESLAKIVNSRTRKGNGSGSYSSRSKEERVDRKSMETLVSSVLEEDKSEKISLKDWVTNKNQGSRGKGEKASMPCFKNEDVTVKSLENKGSLAVDDKKEEKIEKRVDDANGVGEGEKKKKKRKGSKAKKLESLEVRLLKTTLDTCSKGGDVMGAIELYDMAQREGIKLEQYHYAVILYLCSSTAVPVGATWPAKSRRETRTSNANVSNDNSSHNMDGSSNKKKKLEQSSDVSTPVQNDSRDDSTLKDGTGSGTQQDEKICLSEDDKKYAMERGYEIYERMCLDKVPVNEAILTSLARMAMSMGNGDMAFDMVKQMKSMGINPRLRSYGPALFVYCNSGDVDKAFVVEEHMLEHGVHPEEPELEALLRVSVGAGRVDKVYYVLHKLRTSVRKVSSSTADLIVKWFESKAASKVGKTRLDHRLIKEAIVNGGGGWHGQGWLGKGKWIIMDTVVGADGICRCCGEKLATIDLDPVETENFAESVASIAIKKEKNSSFQKFQKWLDDYGPFEAVVDGANVGLLSGGRFMPTKVNGVANGIRRQLPSNKWPLIVLHNRRVFGPKMNDTKNRTLIEKWRTADALYATPTGSNDDWYWLYAAIKCKGLIVTNDEMRDHTFQLLGNDFFPKWKERHQVRISYSDTGLLFHMPPSCSIVIQESEKGHWHIPVESEHDYEENRKWLCITRDKSSTVRKNSYIKIEEAEFLHHDKGAEKPVAQTQAKTKSLLLNHGDDAKSRNPPKQMHKNLGNIVSASPFSKQASILLQIEAAEKRGNCNIDFQI